MSLRALLDGLPIPILQAPMVGASPPEMALAVSGAGGMGSLAAGALAPEAIGPQVEAFRTASAAPFGVNLLMAPSARPDAASVDAALARLAPWYAELGEAPPSDWASDLDLVPVLGNKITTEVVFFHRPSGTVLFTDLLQQFPKGWFRGWRAVVARLDLMSEPEPAVPRKFRVAQADRAAGKAAIARILAWPCERVVMAHGTPVERDGRAFLARAFRWLAG